MFIINYDHISLLGNHIKKHYQLDWGVEYMHPYVWEESYHNWLKNNGGTYANAASYHFDAKSHRLWAEHVLQYIYDNHLIESNEIPAD